MLTWPHCGFHVHTAVWVPEEDRAFATRLARYCARNPVALERLTYDRAAKAVTYRSDKSEGPTAGTETVDLRSSCRGSSCTSPTRGTSPRDATAGMPTARAACGRRRSPPPRTGPPAIVPTPRLAPTEASRRWASLLQQIFEVDPLACPACHGAMRVVAFITQASVIDQILTHLRTRAAQAAHAGARSPQSTRRPAGPGAPRRFAAIHRAP